MHLNFVQKLCPVCCARKMPVASFECPLNHTYAIDELQTEPKLQMFMRADRCVCVCFVFVRARAWALSSRDLQHPFLFYFVCPISWCLITATTFVSLAAGKPPHNCELLKVMKPEDFNSKVEELITHLRARASAVDVLPLWHLREDRRYAASEATPRSPHLVTDASFVLVEGDVINGMFRVGNPNAGLCLCAPPLWRVDQSKIPNPCLPAYLDI